MLDNASETIATRVQQAAATSCNAILQTVARTVAGTGPALLQAPLFKAGKALTKYATLSDNSSTETTEFKEVIVTAHHTHKVLVKVTQPTKEKLQQFKEKSAAPLPSASSVTKEELFQQATDGNTDDAEQRLKKLENAPPLPQPSFEVKVEWSNSLASIVSVDPLFDSIPGAEDAPAAVFSVVFLCPTKDAKDLAETFSNKKDSGMTGPTGTDNKTNEVLAKMTKKRSALEWTLLAFKRNAETPLLPVEADHLQHVFKLGKPSLRCRAYLVPSVLGGGAQRDEWVAVYRAAIQNYWQERLEASIINSPEIFQYCAWAQFAGAGNGAKSTNLTADLPASTYCLTAISTKKLYIVNATEGNLLNVESGKISPTSTRSAEISSISQVFLPTASAPFVVAVECGGRPFAQFQFLCGQHAADFVLEVQRIFLLVNGEDAEFPIVKEQ